MRPGWSLRMYTPAIRAGRTSARRRAWGRLLQVDDLVRIRTYERLREIPRAPDPAQMPERERRLLRMLVGSLVAGAVTKDMSLREGATLLWDHPQVVAELVELFAVLATRLEHVATPLSSTHAEVPLEIHAR